MIPRIEACGNHSDPEVRVFGYPKMARGVGLVGLIFFSALAVCGFALPLLHPEDVHHPLLAATPSASCFGSFAVLSGYLLVASYRVRLVISKAVICRQGVVRYRTVPLAQVTRAVWRGWPVGGRLTLFTNDSRLVIHLGNYTEPWQLSSILRHTLPLEVQERYARYEAACVPASDAFCHRQGR